MPVASKKPCNHPMCSVLVEGGIAYCDKHRKQNDSASEANRLTAADRGYGHKWREAREGFLRKHPLCECPGCQAGKLRIRIATVVDHIIPHKLGQAKLSRDKAAIDRAIHLFWDRNNWQAMNKTCHDEKTAREDGSFGRVVGSKV